LVTNAKCRQAGNSTPWAPMRRVRRTISRRDARIVSAICASPVSGRPRQEQAHGRAKQVASVERVMAELIPGIPLYGALCFVGVDLPLLGSLGFNGYPLLYPKQLATRINGGGPLTREGVHALAIGLDGRSPRPDRQAGTRYPRGSARAPSPGGASGVAKVCRLAPGGAWRCGMLVG
jgi:hypothetical protein